MSLGEKAHDYATGLVNDAVKNAEPSMEIKINHLVNTINVMISDTEDLKNTLAQVQGASLDDIKGGIEKVLSDLLEELKVQFPPPDQAPSHAERQGNVTLVLHKAEDAFIKLCVQHGMSEAQVRVHLHPIMNYMETVVVTLGASTLLTVSYFPS